MHYTQLSRCWSSKVSGLIVLQLSLSWSGIQAIAHVVTKNIA